MKNESKSELFDDVSFSAVKHLYEHDSHIIKNLKCGTPKTTIGWNSTESVLAQVRLHCDCVCSTFVCLTIKNFAVTESQWIGSLSYQLLDLKLDFCKLAKNTCTYETVKLILVNYLFYWECHHFDYFPDFKTCMHC